MPVCVREERASGLFGTLFHRKLLLERKHMERKDQNLTIMCIGETGSGKSTLGIHAFNILEGGIDYERYSTDAETIASAIIAANKRGKYSFILMDELNPQSRRSMSRFNNDFIDLLMNIRGKNFIIWGNNPSVDTLDKIFVQEKLVDHFLFIHANQARFMWFEHSDMMRLLEDKKDLKLRTLKKYGRYYAKFDTWFSPIPRDDWESYLEHKEARMDEKIRVFGETYKPQKEQGRVGSLNYWAIERNVGYKTMLAAVTRAIEGGVVSPDVRQLNGRYKMTKEEAIASVKYYTELKNNSAPDTEVTGG